MRCHLQAEIVCVVAFSAFMLEIDRHNLSRYDGRCEYDGNGGGDGELHVDSLGLWRGT